MRKRAGAHRGQKPHTRGVVYTSPGVWGSEKNYHSRMLGRAIKTVFGKNPQRAEFGMSLCVTVRTTNIAFSDFCHDVETARERAGLREVVIESPPEPH